MPSIPIASHSFDLSHAGYSESKPGLAAFGCLMLTVCTGAHLVPRSQLNAHTLSCPLTQATVQATLALLPLDAVIAAYKSNPRSAEAVRYTRYANEALTAAVFTILIAGSIGTLLIRIFAPLLLDRVSLRDCVPNLLITGFALLL